MKAIIFGGSGPDGFYLRHFPRTRNVEAIRSGKELRGDVSDWNFTQELIRTHRPAFIFHLAANSTTRHEALFDNHSAISTGKINILEATRATARPAKCSCRAYSPAIKEIDFIALLTWRVSEIDSTQQS